MLLVVLVLFLFLGNVRAAVIVSVTIPFGLLFAFSCMNLIHVPANLLSLGAIDFGVIVNGSVIMVENIYRRLATRSPGESAIHSILSSTAEVQSEIAYTTLIIIVAYLPLFTMQSVEKKMFAPMAYTISLALIGSLVMALMVAPVLCSLLLRGNLSDKENPATAKLKSGYRVSLKWVLANPIPVLVAAACLFGLSLMLMPSLGTEFLPHLDEGNLWIRATMPNTISYSEASKLVPQMRYIMEKYQPVKLVVSQLGRPDDGTDATGFFNAEFFVPLKPFESWPSHTTKEQLTQDMTNSLAEQFPGVEFNFSQYIQDNVEEAASGVKGENSVKVYGNDLDTLEKTADAVAAVLAKVPGITDLAVLRSLGQPTIRIDIDRVRAARFGLAPGDVNAVVQTAIGGQSAGDLYEGSSDRHFPMMVRLAAPFRQSLDAIRHIPIAAQAANGSGVIQIALQDVADVGLVSGAAFIYREQQQRYVPIKFSVRGRDLGGAVLEAQHEVESTVPLPGGYRLEWVGEFGNLQEAAARLSVAVPLSLALIVLLLYLNFSSLRDALLAASVIPMAMLGGILALWVSGTPFSVSSAIGFVALFGIAAMDGILILSYYHLSLESGLDRASAMLQTCRTQLRPVMMTCIVACVGLLPAAFSTGIGSQVQRPLALVVVGGMLLAPVLILLVLPVLILKFSRAQALPEELPRESAT
jgi:cobalt-zinc-cadmium resistance protein CzcA